MPKHRKQKLTTTTAGDGFHGLTFDAVLNTLEYARDTCQITDQDYADILNFVNRKRGLLHVSTARCRKIVYILTSWRRCLGEFRTRNIDDVAAAVVELTTCDNKCGRPFSDSCIYDHIRVLKGFYSWMIAEGICTTITERQLAEIHTPKTSDSKYTERDVLTVDQIRQIISACKTAEEKALFTTFYEGALRIGELGTLTWEQVEIRQTHVNLRICFKTGITRQVPIITYQDYLKTWANIHGDVDPKSPVFTNRFGQPYNYAALRKKLQCIGSRVGIRFAPHLIRHSRITHMVLEGIGKEIVGLICWGTVNAGELDRYAHLYGSVDTMILGHYGITVSDEKHAEPLSPVMCSQCGYLNPPGRMFCASCCTPLTTESMKEFEKLADEMTPEMMQKMMAMFIQSKKKG
jgi:site-specific recombinase XerC